MNVICPSLDLDYDTKGEAQAIDVEILSVRQNPASFKLQEITPRFDASLIICNILTGVHGL